MAWLMDLLVLGGGALIDHGQTRRSMQNSSIQIPPTQSNKQETWELILASGLDSILRQDVFYQATGALANAAGPWNHQ